MHLLFYYTHKLIYNRILKLFVDESTSDMLLKVQLNILEAKQCNDSYFSNDRVDLKSGILPDSMICAGSDNDYQDTCSVNGYFLNFHIKLNKYIFDFCRAIPVVHFKSKMKIIQILTHSLVSLRLVQHFVVSRKYPECTLEYQNMFHGSNKSFGQIIKRKYHKIKNQC